MTDAIETWTVQWPNTFSQEESVGSDPFPPTHRHTPVPKQTDFTWFAERLVYGEQLWFTVAALCFTHSV